jgi:hypothetical protein
MNTGAPALQVQIKERRFEIAVLIGRRLQTAAP